MSNTNNTNNLANLEHRDYVGDGSKERPVTMGLCEIEHVPLKPYVYYMFLVMPGCDKCKRLQKISNPA